LWNLISPKRVLLPKGQCRLSFDISSSVEILPRHLFLKLLCLVRKRTERSGRPFVLMLLESVEALKAGGQTDTFAKLLSALSRSVRETDITGWYAEGSTLGVIFTEVGATDPSIVGLLSTRVYEKLSDVLSAEEFSAIALSFHVFPDDCKGEHPCRKAFTTFYPDLMHDVEAKKASLLLKRGIDILGSLSALILLSPLIILIAAAITLTSRGPILFRQNRLGQYGKSFTFLKFRSMYATNDHTIHEAYVKRFISAPSDGGREGESQQLYKISADPRVTRVGRILRRTSLDELPQFFNTLMGQMALVGPRPPIPYEFNSYEMWHRRRLLAVKPGITGLWQVKGRSRVKFNEMVRMDLEYARTWSVWLDLKILLQTPRAVIVGDGAF
jgi:lipopolysaccharide/colanic/teichoic acid biosynthesis glycosyltransferase